MLETVRRRPKLGPRPPAACPEPIAPAATDYPLACAAGWTLGVAAVLVTGKALLLPWTGSNPLDIARWTLRLAIVSASDLRFAALLGAGLTLVGAFGGRNRWLRGSLATLAALAALYGVAGVTMFRLMMVPLTAPLLSFAGGPALMASSLAQVATREWMIGAALAAAAPWLGARFVLRFQQATIPQGLLRPRPLAAAVCLTLAAAAVADAYVESRWTDPNRWERRIAQNPHTALLSSLGSAALRGDALALSFAPERVDESDFLAAPAGGATGTTGSPRPRNLIVIVLESVGVEHLQLYGAAHDTTPRLAELAAERGLVFENCYAHAPSSPKGLVALTASVYPGIDWKLISRDAPAFDVPTLPQVLHQRGYRTAYAHSGYWEWKNRDRFLRERGVDDVIDASTLGSKQVFSWGISDADLFDSALAWIDRQPDQPFHLLLWTIETHHPYVEGSSPRDYGVDDPELNRYLNALRNIDALIGKLVDELERRGLADSTLIAVTGDHGEAFGQHGQRVHSFGVYEENLHVPLVLIEPRSADAEAGRRVPDVCQQIDIAPTLLARMGIASPREWQGRDALAAIGSPHRAYFYSTGNEVLLGLRDAHWKYHYAVGSGREELFDLDRDPRELHNLVAREPRRAAEYRARVAGLVTYQRRYLAQHGVD